MKVSVTLGHAGNRDHRDKFSTPSLRSHTVYKNSEETIWELKTLWSPEPQITQARRPRGNRTQEMLPKLHPPNKDNIRNQNMDL